jgi:hypothetical protein
MEQGSITAGLHHRLPGRLFPPPGAGKPQHRARDYGESRHVVICTTARFF